MGELDDWELRKVAFVVLMMKPMLMMEDGYRRIMLELAGVELG